MRIDKFLQSSGLIKRRVLANEACKRGLILVNGVKAKPTRELTGNEKIEILLPHRETEILLLKNCEMKSIPKFRRDEFFRIIRDEIKEHEPEDLFALPEEQSE
ncbi:MAG: RNA-binding S4 domain-containing protein [Candidatus Riflebacteria bacterium]|nr:RNA-binding S4 domain-containing protein [Candidatus Riflebacteria bacterium]